MRFQLLRSTRFQTLIKATLLVATGVFLYGRLANGTLYYYINERYMGFTVFAVVGLVGVGLAYQFGRPLVHELHGQASSADPNHAHEPDHGHSHQHDDGHNHEHNHDSDHGHGHSHALSWGGVMLVALPVILGLAVPPRPLGVAALENREVNLTSEGSALPAAVRAANAKAADQRNMLDWWRTFQASSDYGDVVGERARVVGFVYHDEQYPAGHFVATRFIVSCCVADAAVVGLLVQWPDTVALEDDQWVEISGPFVPSSVDGWPYPVLAAEAIAPVDVPQQPYLYP